MIVVLLPATMTVYADDSGTLENGIKWSWYWKSGTVLTYLTISGTGDIPDYGYGASPWDSYAEDTTNLIIYNGIKTIGKCAFAGFGLREKTIPASVTKIGEDAFSLGSALYRNYVNITDLEAWLKIDFANEYANPLYQLQKLKLNGSSVSTVTVPETIKEIKPYSFINCSSLQRITIPKNVTAIGEKAFFNCSSLRSIDVDPENPNYSSVDGVLFNKDKTELICYPAGKTNSSYVVPDSVTLINKNAFYGCTQLTNVTINDRVTTIEENTFYGCIGLTSILIPDNITTIKRQAFYGCTNLKELTIGKNVITIDYNAFYECEGLKTINWNATNVSDFSSYNTTFLYAGKTGGGISVIFGDTVEKIPAYCFGKSSYADRPRITVVTFGRSVKEIGTSALAFGSKLNYNGSGDDFTKITIGAENYLLDSESKRYYFYYVTVIDENSKIILEKMNNIDAMFNPSSIGRIGYTTQLYTEAERINEFDYENTPITENAVFYVQYKPNAYLNKFINYDGSVVFEGLTNYGTRIEIPDIVPTKPADDQYTYTFAGWEGFEEGITQKAEEMVFTANYDKTVNQYSYHFVDEDGTVLKEDTVDYGTEIVPPENPSKQGSAQYSYTFTGWDGFTEGMTQTAEDLYFYATYSASINKYTYKFVDWDGTVLKEKTVNYNTMITPPSNPSKAPDAQYTYTFTGWDGYTVGMKATGDVTFTATYSNTVNQYTYKFVDALGNTILEKTVDYGTVIELPQEEITKAPDDEFTYTFTGWDGYTEDMTVTGNITFAPLFSKTTNKYSYQFVDEDGTVLNEDTVDY